MRGLLIAILVAVSVALLISMDSCSRHRQEARRLDANQSTLLTEAMGYKVRDSLNAISTGVLTLNLQEFKKYRAADAALVKDLGLRIQRLQSMTTTTTEGNYNVVTKVVRDTVRVLDTILPSQRIEHHTPYIDLTATIQGDTASIQIAVRDTIVQVLHRVPRWRFLGIHFGTKAVRQETVSKNPHTTIVAGEYLKIK